MAKKYEWNIKLRPNAFTPDNDRDQLADVEPNGATKRDEDIADAIIAEGTEFTRETILAILAKRNKKVMEFVLNGSNYSNEIEQFSPRVQGVFEDINAPFDPAIHKCTVDISAGSTLRSELQNVGAKVIGVKDSGGAKIGAVTNSLTGAKDGTVPIGDDVIIEGEKIKIQDEADEAQGVFFVGADGAEKRVARKLTANKPGQIIARVPADVAEGSVSLIVRTKYTASATILKNVREIRYAYALTAVKP